MTTDLLTREEMHARVDALFDTYEECNDDEPIALVGDVVGDLDVSAPNEKRGYYTIDPIVGFADFSFDGGCYPLGEAVRTKGQRGLTGTVIVGKDDLSETVTAALDGDEEAIAELTGGADR
ncbi:hypothetical protein [Natronobacterium gregoryi]|uniref:Uncharacterized protein n=2 Tax=Natronobacterium gregoryi TaxID=44930 RepID=L0AN44_NATGS|nr:hypothetical protein [Natronobacterium gregoryi]AFZ74597.1 hypothetical protein Natgr_3478 [Natronobacterium gregoryi SP2]ELY72579.1 hypothetical protein C490_03283 [Natronobacterium gregoryi SP2]PLK19787.1 hypothetical protein CYV19_12830 [Natronobacterium gregoryi SP2]SFJ30179.1 hypothetical protein SAMN05443661_12115 [Natronobacterium gregoryi]